MNVEIRKLHKTELDKFRELIRVFEDVFEMQDFKMPPDEYLQRLLASDSFFVFVAILNNQVVGGLTSYILPQYYSESSLVYIYDLAVKTVVQRKGIGKLLIAENNGYCKEIGAEVVMVQADEVDGYAIDFYSSTGGTPEKVVHFDYKLSDNN